MLALGFASGLVGKTIVAMVFTYGVLGGLGWVSLMSRPSPPA